MNRDDFFQAGKVIKPSGSSGDVILSFNKEITNLKKTESAFILLQGNLIPFFIDRIESRGRNQYLVSFLDVRTGEEVTPLLGASVFLPNSMQPRKRPGKHYDFDLEGFRVIDRNFGEIGTVSGVLELPMQELLEVSHQGKQILIPLADEIVEELDEHSKTIYIRAPEGLIEIYL